MQVIELEKSFILENINEVIQTANENNYKIKDEIKEIDTYFVDEKEEFVKTKTCLRLRRKNDNDMELTYKPKTSSKTEKYGKKEINVPININAYRDIKYILKELGYKEYIEFTKYRVIYSKKEKNIEYNIMIDKIKNVGEYIEFEIITDERYDEEQRKNELMKFLKLFKTGKMKPKDKPYRDIVKEYIDKR